MPEAGGIKEVGGGGSRPRGGLGEEVRFTSRSIKYDVVKKKKKKKKKKNGGPHTGKTKRGEHFFF